MRKGVFRQTSIERLSSPEQLDQLMQVTTSKSWIALTALTGLLVAAIVWGVLGHIPTRVQGTGVLIKTGGVYDIVPLASGQLTDLAVRPGDMVREGQVVARIDQPMLLERLKQARERLDDLKTRHSRLAHFGENDVALQSELASRQEQTLQQSIQSTEAQITWLEGRIDSQEALEAEGILTEQQVNQTRQQLQAARERAEQLRHERKQVSIRELSVQNQRQQERFASELQIRDVEREIAQLEEQVEMSTRVESPYTGRILEVMAEVGTLINQGHPVMRLDRIGDDIQDLEAVLYLPIIEGKKVKPGMEVQIAPSTIKREEHGFMLGTVTRVSDFPATSEGMLRTLKNGQLVQALAGGGAPYETYATLQVDPATFSGYKWSSSRGPDTRIQSGTLCTASITVEKQRPIELVLPVLRRFTGVGV